MGLAVSVAEELRVGGECICVDDPGNDDLGQNVAIRHQLQDHDGPVSPDYLPSQLFHERTKPLKYLTEVRITMPRKRNTTLSVSVNFAASSDEVPKSGHSL